MRNASAQLDRLQARSPRRPRRVSDYSTAMRAVNAQFDRMQAEWANTLCPTHGQPGRCTVCASWAS